LNSELIDFYRKARGKKFCCQLGVPNTAEYHRLAKKKSKTVCEHIRFNKAGWGGTYAKGYGWGAAKRNNVFCFDTSRLSNVSVENKDFREVVKQHDSKDTVFYVDPPYVKANEKECFYGKGMCNVTPKEVASTFKRAKGKAIVSYDNHPSVKKAFKGWKCKRVKLPYTMNKKMRTSELLCKNW
jgi:site-specific DNA-adenine methylase